MVPAHRSVLVRVRDPSQADQACRCILCLQESPSAPGLPPPIDLFQNMSCDATTLTSKLQHARKRGDAPPCAPAYAPTIQAHNRSCAYLHRVFILQEDQS